MVGQYVILFIVYQPVMSAQGRDGQQIKLCNCLPACSDSIWQYVNPAIVYMPIVSSHARNGK